MQFLKWFVKDNQEGRNQGRDCLEHYHFKGGPHCTKVLHESGLKSNLKQRHVFLWQKWISPTPVYYFQALIIFFLSSSMEVGSENVKVVQMHNIKAYSIYTHIQSISFIKTCQFSYYYSWQQYYLQTAQVQVFSQLPLINIVPNVGFWPFKDKNDLSQDVLMQEQYWLLVSTCGFCSIKILPLQ